MAKTSARHHDHDIYLVPDMLCALHRVRMRSARERNPSQHVLQILRLELWVLSTTSQAIIDWILTGTALAVILFTRFDTRVKASVCVILGLEVLGSIMSVVRIPFIRDLDVTAALMYFGNLVNISMMSCAEYGLSITALSLAALRPLIDKFRATVLTANDSRSKSYPQDMALHTGPSQAFGIGRPQEKGFEC